MSLITLGTHTEKKPKGSDKGHQYQLKSWPNSTDFALYLCPWYNETLLGLWQQGRQLAKLKNPHIPLLGAGYLGYTQYKQYPPQCRQRALGTVRTTATHHSADTERCDVAVGNLNSKLEATVQHAECVNLSSYHRLLTLNFLLAAVYIITVNILFTLSGFIFWYADYSLVFLISVFEFKCPSTLMCLI